MKQAVQTHAPEEDAIERLVKQCADNPLAPRVLMRLYGSVQGRPLAEFAEPLRVHPSKARKALRIFVLAGLVTERGSGRNTTYSLSASPSDRRLVTELLHRVIDAGSSRTAASGGRSASSG